MHKHGDWLQYRKKRTFTQSPESCSIMQHLQFTINTHFYSNRVFFILPSLCLSHCVPPRIDRVQVGMRILEVNGTSLLGATHQEAVNALRAAGNDINVIVCKGYDKSSLIHSIGSAGGMSTGIGGSISSRLGSRASETGSERSQSVSSLDREEGDDSVISPEATTPNNEQVNSKRK